jgi:hypothetical protein
MYFAYDQCFLILARVGLLLISLADKDICVVSLPVTLVTFLVLRCDDEVTLNYFPLY